MSSKTRKRKDWAGQKHNALTFVRPVEGSKQWEAQCDCGVMVRVIPSDGRRRSCRACYLATRKKDWTGQKYSYLTFVRPSHITNKNKETLWELECECGTIVVKRPQQVSTGRVVSCGCMRGIEKRKYSPIVSSAMIKWRSVYKELPFNTFYELSQLPCDYCGRQPYRSFNKKKWGRTGSNISNYQRDHGTFTYNGLDRVDSSKGHTVDNVVPCCYRCNIMKGDMTRQAFIDHNESIYLHSARQGRLTPK
jgi:hypothetical protein